MVAPAPDTWRLAPDTQSHTDKLKHIGQWVAIDKLEKGAYGAPIAVVPERDPQVLLAFQTPDLSRRLIVKLASHVVACDARLRPGNLNHLTAGFAEFLANDRCGYSSPRWSNMKYPDLLRSTSFFRASQTKAGSQETHHGNKSHK